MIFSRRLFLFMHLAKMASLSGPLHLTIFVRCMAFYMHLGRESAVKWNFANVNARSPQGLFYAPGQGRRHERKFGLTKPECGL